MTIRQMLLTTDGAGSGPSSQSFKGFAGASTSSVTLPTHAANDVLVMIAAGYDTVTVPDGWTEKQRLTDAGRNVVLASKVAASDAEESGTWTNATKIMCGVWDGFSGIGGSAKRYGPSGTIYWPAVTMTQTDGTSWVAGMIFATGYTSTIVNPPTGMTHRGALLDDMAIHDTAAGVSSWPTKTTTMGGGWYTGSGWVFTFELVAE